MSQSDFRYLPLLTPHSIRLLHLQPALGASSPIYIKFSEIQLPISRPKTRSFAKYEALSYTWGEPGNRLPIRTPVGTLLVTRNLFEAFIHLRRAGQARTLWVDAVCINQDDLPERAAQVRLMGQVYSLAARVVVWLGPASDSSETVPALVKRLASFSDHCDRDGSIDIATDDARKRHELPPREAPDWTALAALLRRPWTTRVWVVQEVALSPSTVVMCGHDEMSWDDLGNAASIVPMAQLMDRIELAGTQGITLICVMAFQYRSGGLHALEDQLVAARRFQATDPRDKIFGLLGLASPVNATQIKVDYEVDTASLFIKISWHLIRRSGTLRILEHAEFGQLISGLPSWVPDWSFRLGEDFEIRPFPDHYYLSCNRHSLVLVGGENGRRLCVGGIRIDTVDEVSVVLEDDGGREIAATYGRWEERFSGVLDKWESLAARIGIQHYSGDVYGDDFVNAYWKTITGHAMANEVSEEFAQHFRDWYEIHRPHGEMDMGMVRSMDSTWDSESGAMVFSDKVFMVTYGKRYGRTGRNYMGIFPRKAKDGDTVVILFGCRLPVVLRERKDGWEFIGVCYVHGICLDDFVASSDTTTTGAATFSII